MNELTQIKLTAIWSDEEAYPQELPAVKLLDEGYMEALLDFVLKLGCKILIESAELDKRG